MKKLLCFGICMMILSSCSLLKTNSTSSSRTSYTSSSKTSSTETNNNYYKLNDYFYIDGFRLQITGYTMYDEHLVDDCIKTEVKMKNTSSTSNELSASITCYGPDGVETGTKWWNTYEKKHIPYWQVITWSRGNLLYLCCICWIRIIFF